MRARFFLPAFLLVVSLPILADEEKKENTKELATKVDLSYLEKTWGLKCVSQKVTPVGFRGSQITFRLEFTKDVENLKELREEFTARPSNSPDSPLWFYFFDDENVTVYKSPPNKIEGEITGTKGDAFRVTILAFSKETLDKTKKIAARPREKVKKK